MSLNRSLGGVEIVSFKKQESLLLPCHTASCVRRLQICFLPRMGFSVGTGSAHLLCRASALVPRRGGARELCALSAFASFCNARFDVGLAQVAANQTVQADPASTGSHNEWTRESVLRNGLCTLGSQAVMFV